MREETKAILDRRTMIALTAAAATGVAAGCVRPAKGGVSTASIARRRFESEVVIITRATSDIGRAAADQFAAEGGKVAFCGRRENLGHAVEVEIKSRGGEATYIRADVRDESQVKAFVDLAVKKYGHLAVTQRVQRLHLELSRKNSNAARDTQIRSTDHYPRRDDAQAPLCILADSPIVSGVAFAMKILRSGVSATGTPGAKPRMQL